jgi:hypothetical protein
MMKETESPSMKKAIRYGAKYKRMRILLKVYLVKAVMFKEPIVPPCEDWSTMEK